MKAKFLIPVFISVVLGYGFSELLIGSYDSRLESIFNDSDGAYFVKYKTYNSKAAMEEDTEALDDFIYIVERDKYHVVLGISKNQTNAENLKAIHKENGNESSIVRRNIFNIEFVNKLVQYDTLMQISNDTKNTLLINQKILQLYQEMETRNDA